MSQLVNIVRYLKHDVVRP